MSNPIWLAALVAMLLGGNSLARAEPLKLPTPQQAAGASLFDVLKQRRSNREFSPRALSKMAVGGLLWAAQGVTSPEGLRTAPSAGALYPLTLRLVAGSVDGLEAGIYRYNPGQHALSLEQKEDLRQELAVTAFHQTWVAEAPAIIVICADYLRTTGKYGKRGVRYVHMEAGHAAQNLLLQAEEMGLSAVVVGAFEDKALKSLLKLTGEETPLSILPIGYASQ
jgi:SagB-type dehydrogenase family enzyme